MDFGKLKETWWKTLTEAEKAKYHEFPAYIKMRNYVESGGNEEALLNCTFRYVVQAIKGSLDPKNASRLFVAMNDWNLDNYLMGLYWDSKDTVKMAKDMIYFDVLSDEFEG